MARRILTVAAALVLALLGTLLVVAYVGRADARALEGVETVDVVVAAGTLAEGQTVALAQAAGLLTTQQLPRRSVPEGALVELTPAEEPLVFASDVTPGEIIQRPRLVTAVADDGTLAVPAGKLAVTVQLADPARVAGFVTVGSQITVFDSFNVFEGHDGSSWTPSGDRLSEEFDVNKATRVLLPNVQVLAVGEQTVAADEPGSAAEPEGENTGAASDPNAAAERLTLVTVAVTQREAEKLVHGTQTGTLYLGLLGENTDVQPGKGVDNRTLFDK